VNWPLDLDDKVFSFLDELSSGLPMGRFRPVATGRIDGLNNLPQLGYSCFALKSYYMLNQWSKLSQDNQNSWVQYLQSFQSHEHRAYLNNAFVDDAMYQYLRKKNTWNIKGYINRYLNNQPQEVERAIIAETKQCISTLHQVGKEALEPYEGIPYDLNAVRHFLSGLNWNKPWSAGGQAAALVVFLITHGPKKVSKSELRVLVDECRVTYARLANPNTGSYHTHDDCEDKQLVNGAMKALNALEWMDEKIHYPKALIDLCLRYRPQQGGCHLVDVVYCLYRCSKEVDHRRLEVQEYCQVILKMIDSHHKESGGFSYQYNKSRTQYYGVPMSIGLDEGDVHGTCLLIWAIVMILDLVENNPKQWKPIKA
jgi:hypothetical protein